MIRVTEKSDEIVLRSFQLKSFALGLTGFIFFGSFIFLIFPDAENKLKFSIDFDQETFWFLLTIVFYFLIVAISAWTFLAAEMLTVRIKRNMQTIEITRRNLISTTQTQRVFFSQIKELTAVKRASQETKLFYDFKTPLYFNALWLVNELIIEIQVTGTRKDFFAERRAALNKFLETASQPLGKNN